MNAPPLDRAPTKPLDSTALLLAQLGRIERSIETLPGLLARLDTLTESTRQLETALRETAADLRRRDDAQQKALDSVKTDVNGNRTAISVVSSEVRDLARAVQRLPIPQAMQDIRDLQARRAQQDDQLADLDTLVKATAARVDGLHQEITQWNPWFKGLKWFALLVGGVFVTALAGALLWSLVQSGAGLP